MDMIRRFVALGGRSAGTAERGVLPLYMFCLHSAFRLIYLQRDSKKTCTTKGQTARIKRKAARVNNPVSSSQSLTCVHMHSLCVPASACAAAGAVLSGHMYCIRLALEGDLRE